MIYVVCALQAEANAIIMHYKLQKKHEESRFKIFHNDKISLIISGVGKIKSSAATAYLLKDSSSCDAVINFGIAAAPKNLGHIGEVFAIKSITDNSTSRTYYCDILFSHTLKETQLATFDLPQFSLKTSLADMEASGFFISALHFLKSSRIFTVKIISDHFEQRQLKKDEIVQMIKKKIKDIDNFVELASLQNN